MGRDALTVTDRPFLWCGKSPNERLIWDATWRHRLSQFPRRLVEQARRGESLSPCIPCDHPPLLHVREAMELLYPRSCGIDVHKKLLVACVILVVDGHQHKEIRTFATTTKGILDLLDWLQALDCTHVAMESTGVYWRPVYNLLEGHFEPLVVNAQHIKAVPGRKTDVRDAEWVADLLQHGLLKGSYIPLAPQRELRDLTRYRTSLVQERARAVNRLQKTLEDTNIKLGDVATGYHGQIRAGDARSSPGRRA
jgi:hypothetical protein